MRRQVEPGKTATSLIFGVFSTLFRTNAPDVLISSAYGPHVYNVPAFARQVKVT